MPQSKYTNIKLLLVGMDCILPQSKNLFFICKLNSNIFFPLVHWKKNGQSMLLGWNHEHIEWHIIFVSFLEGKTIKDDNDCKRLQTHN